MSARSGAARRAVAAATAWPRHAPAPRTRPRPAARPELARPRHRRARLRLGLAVIPVIALMLSGIVWITGAQLALTNRTSQLAVRYREVQAEARRLQLELARGQGAVVAQATSRLGMIQAPSGSVTYLTAPPRTS
jgi:cell division protein FtsL